MDCIQYFQVYYTSFSNTDYSVLLNRLREILYIYVWSLIVGQGSADPNQTVLSNPIMAIRVFTVLGLVCSKS